METPVPFHLELDLSRERSAPVYRQLTDAVIARIEAGELLPGTRLPPVRDLADQLGFARGTVKHAYDTLESMGYIQMTQGRGTYVKTRPPKPQGRKEQAMLSIEALLGEMDRLGFTPGETRIFFELKLREREQESGRVRIGVVDCCPEALQSILTRLSAIPYVETGRFLLDEVLRSPGQLDDGYDLIITTAKHYDDLRPHMPYGVRLMRIVLTASPATVSHLAKVPANARAGILAASKRFSVIIRRGCAAYCALPGELPAFYLGGGESLEAFLSGFDYLVLPPDYLGYCTPREEEAILAFEKGGGELVPYNYQVDSGSLLYLEEQIQKLRRK